MLYQHLLTILFLMFNIQTLNSQCIPLYPRMFYNPDSQTTPNKIDLIFMFNTDISCPLSYVQISYNKIVSKFACAQSKMETFNADKSSEFVQYIQKCKSNIIQDFEIQQFSYKPYGCKSLLQCIPYSSQALLVQYPTSNQPLKFVVLSDWSPLTSAQRYEPINKTLQYVIQKRRLEKLQGKSSQWRINGLIMQGDYAYDMETNQGQSYINFMVQITKISKYWPIIPNSGNHQTGHVKSKYLFQNSFVIGRISTADGVFQRTQTYRFANRLTLVHYDAFQELYRNRIADHYEQLMNAIKQELIKARTNYPNDFVILGSHYPVKCSQNDDQHCVTTLDRIPQLFDFLSTPYEGKGLVDLYIGGHMHQYQRIWPFVNNMYVNQSSPYKRGRLVSIIEGAAGNTEDLIQAIVPNYFSAAQSVNVTGFGIISLEGNSANPGKPFFINYKHVTSRNVYELVDEFVITNGYKTQENLLQE